MKFFEERFFNRRNWMLENIYKLKLSPAEVLLLMEIDFCNEFNENITVDYLSEKLNLTIKEVDETIQQLVSKGYLKVTSKQMKAKFNINQIFDAANNVIINSNIYDLFETELGKVLSQKEVNIISEWLMIYDYDEIVDALREALINKKKSIAYIDKVLANGAKDE